VATAEGPLSAARLARRKTPENTAVVETELRYDVTPRWGAIGFVGAGR
jgi:hypothetical protein